jgi:hypothetical protein
VADIILYIFIAFACLATVAFFIKPGDGGGGSDRGGFDGM